MSLISQAIRRSAGTWSNMVVYMHQCVLEKDNQNATEALRRSPSTSECADNGYGVGVVKNKLMYFSLEFDSRNMFQ